MKCDKCKRGTMSPRYYKVIKQTGEYTYEECDLWICEICARDLSKKILDWYFAIT